MQSCAFNLLWQHQDFRSWRLCIRNALHGSVALAARLHKPTSQPTALPGFSCPTAATSVTIRVRALAPSYT